MILVKIKGGLGNQMFGYAYAKSLEKLGFDVKIDISAFQAYKLHGGYQLDKYNIDLDIATKDEVISFGELGLMKKIKKRFKINNSQVIKEKSLIYDKEMLNPSDNKYIDGYFQTERYFDNIKETLLDQFVIKKDISDYSKLVKKKIEQSKASVALHIRRGDYIDNKDNFKLHGYCSLEYYREAMSELNRKINDISYFVFSDDMSWVKENLKLENAFYVDDKEKRIPHEDIYLMSLCNHNIIANSTFSWWGAWLNKNDKKIVIAPKKWFADEKMEQQAIDIVPQNWMRM